MRPRQGRVPGDRAGIGERGDLVDHDAQPGRVVRSGVPVVGEGPVQRVGAPVGEQAHQLCEQLAPLPLHESDPVVGAHHVVGAMPLSTAISSRVSSGTTRSAAYRTNGPSPASRTSRAAMAPQKRPIRSLVRFLSAARERRCRRTATRASRRPRAQLGQGLVEHLVGGVGRYQSRTVSPHRRLVDAGGRCARRRRRPRRRGRRPRRRRGP